MFSLFRVNVLIAINSIKTQLLRTILTVVIIGIGIWALVGILSSVEAMENSISGNFATWALTLLIYNVMILTSNVEVVNVKK